ncbi:DUF1304 family protein [Spirosoma pollinicola]|uniref:DUF1304 domain-containing protein n=1 Tax=Spirosoma pollinicola TaxID=2057025 RepID=A0A2K8Z6S9_9BACT|nr:DUF1304 family protein [Spirosoma pollinicola]AUD05570.1 hypothetical protein CWM47_29245 [Spirosoma pollinicola]
MHIDRFTKALAIFVIFDFFIFFILETVFWMQPFVHNLLLDWFNNPPVTLGYEMHALVLKKLFINQGFYNLFFTIGGIAGLCQLKKNKAVGYALILLVCFAAIGAGLVLAVTSNAYLLAFLQATPAAIAFYTSYPLFKQASANNQ